MGTSLTSFMFCTVELMLTGLCINIPMLQSFYLLYRAEYKNSQLSRTPSQESSSRPREGQQVPPLQPNRGDYSAWIELVCICFFPLSILILLSRMAVPRTFNATDPPWLEKRQR